MYLPFIFKLINIHHSSLGLYVFHRMKKINKNLQDFFGSNDISFTLLTMTQNIVKSDLTSFIEENIYM